MRIEQVNENQIRCILSKDDLLERHLKISELAYGSEKAKDLFREMMEQASVDFGFEADDIPLMIEAIPARGDSIVLLITKVDDPEEFEEKFKRFSPDNTTDFMNDYNLDAIDDGFEDSYDDDFDEEEEDDYPDMDEALPDELINCIDQLNNIISMDDSKKKKDGEFVPLNESLNPTKKKKKAKVAPKKPVKPLIDNAMFSFGSLENIIDAAHIVDPIYQGHNTVWKDENGKRYFLVLERNSKSKGFKEACDIISEYGNREAFSYATKDYLNEHYKVIIKDKALLTLSIM